tara:strand:+ start:213 stop:464 length:252 start_codon:yes stop_codon:yes gene_type:complete
MSETKQNPLSSDITVADLALIYLSLTYALERKVYSDEEVKVVTSLANKIVNVVESTQAVRDEILQDEINAAKASKQFELDLGI